MQDRQITSLSRIEIPMPRFHALGGAAFCRRRAAGQALKGRQGRSGSINHAREALRHAIMSSGMSALV